MLLLLSHTAQRGAPWCALRALRSRTGVHHERQAAPLVAKLFTRALERYRSHVIALRVVGVAVPALPWVCQRVCQRGPLLRAWRQLVHCQNPPWSGRTGRCSVAKTCNSAYEPQLRALLAAHLGTAGLTLIPIPTYLDTIVYEVHTATATVIFKALDPASADPDGVALEAWAYTTLAAANVPVPRVLTLDTSRAVFPGAYIIMEKARGQPLSTLTLGPAAQRHVYEQLGAALQRIHAIDVAGFGWLDDARFRQTGAIQGCAATWADAVLTAVPPAMHYLATQGDLASAEITALEAVVDSITPHLATVHAGQLVHGDLGPLHVWVDPATLDVTAIIDFGERMAGDPLWDFVEYDWDAVASLWAAYAPESGPSPIFGRVFYSYAVLRAMPWAHRWHARGAPHVLDWLRITLARATTAIGAEP